MPTMWILEGQIPKPCHDPVEWARFMESADRRVACTELLSPGAPVVVISTVFLGLDNNFSDQGEPVLFETMTFALGDEDRQRRYCTWDEAEAGHWAMVDSLRVPGCTPSPIPSIPSGAAA